MINWLQAYGSLEYKINDSITVRQPTLGEVRDFGEKEYFGIIQTICSTPSDRKVEIWDSLHVYWDEVTEYDLFIPMFLGLTSIDVSIVFPDLDVESFQDVLHPKTKQIVLRNKDGVVIDMSIYYLLTEYFRGIHRLRKNDDVGENEYTKDIMIEDDREEAELYRKKGANKSLLWPLISTLTNSTGFKYRFDDIWSLPIGVFMDAVEQFKVITARNNLMRGIYSGCIDMSKINKRELDLFPDLNEKK